jgi:hypothetical protein
MIKEYLANYAISLAYRLIHNQGTALKACLGLVKFVTQSVNQPVSPEGQGLKQMITRKACFRQKKKHCAQKATVLV